MLWRRLGLGFLAHEAWCLCSGTEWRNGSSPQCTALHSLHFLLSSIPTPQEWAASVSRSLAHSAHSAHSSQLAGQPEERHWAPLPLPGDPELPCKLRPGAQVPRRSCCRELTVGVQAAALYRVHNARSPPAPHTLPFELGFLTFQTSVSPSLLLGADCLFPQAATVWGRPASRDSLDLLSLCVCVKGSCFAAKPQFR